MKKVLALLLVSALFIVSASAQNEKTENLRRHLIEQRMHNRDGQFRHPGMMNQRQEMMRHRMMRHEIMRHRAIRERRAERMRMMEQNQRRKMMIRRYHFRHRVI